MKKQTIVILVLSLFCSNVFGQKTSQKSNELLQCAIESKEFREFFFVCKHPADTITLIDTSARFSNFSLLLCNRYFAIDTLLPFVINVNKRAAEETKDKIILWHKEGRRQVTFSFFEPFSNANIILKVNKAGRHKVSLIQKGQY